MLLDEVLAERDDALEQSIRNFEPIHREIFCECVEHPSYCQIVDVRVQHVLGLCIEIFFHKFAGQLVNAPKNLIARRNSFHLKIQNSLEFSHHHPAVIPAAAANVIRAARGAETATAL